MQRSSLTSVSRATLFARQGNPAGRDKFQPCERLDSATRVMYEVKHMPLVLFHEWIFFMAACPARTSSWVFLCVVMTSIVLVVVEITGITFEKIDNSIITNLSMSFRHLCTSKVNTNIMITIIFADKQSIKFSRGVG